MSEYENDARIEQHDEEKQMIAGRLVARHWGLSLRTLIRSLAWNQKKKTEPLIQSTHKPKSK